MNTIKKTLSGWGLFPTTKSFVYRPEKLSDLQELNSPRIARGYGRSYGDAAQITDGYVVETARLDRFLAFDAERGVFRAEAGVCLKDVLEVFVPRGWFLPVVPGTQWVSLGGCVAADIHGKNHHLDGSFGRYIRGLEILLANGSKVHCSPKREAELFWATIGGMGLTGLITEVTIQLIPIPSAFISVKNTSLPYLDAVFDYLADSSNDDKYSVAWIDCLAVGAEFGRGVVMNGHHASLKELGAKFNHPFRTKKTKALSLPFSLLSRLLGRRSITYFNQLYFSYLSRNKDPHIVAYEKYFFPLDAAAQWNRIYGKKGFVQYQFVVPAYKAKETCRKVLFMLQRAKYSPYLAVLKRFGPQGQGHLSFPFQGYTLALDIPIYDDGLFPLLDKIDELVIQNEGRIYLAKDARMSISIFRQSYPNLEKWKQVKQQVDPSGKFSSDLAKRLRL